MNDAIEEPKDLQDSRGNITYLLMAELIHGQPALFGVKIRARDFESGLDDLFRHMNRNSGKEFIEVESLQALVSVQLIQCPSCGNITPAGSPRCVQCNMDMRTDEIKIAIRQGKIRVIQSVEQQAKALRDGTQGTHRIRPEHIIVYDVVPPDSPAYKTWLQAKEIAEAQMREIRSGIQMPTPGDMAALEQEKIRRKMGRQ